MTELETIAHAKKYLDEMANGKNPLTGEAVSETDLINNVRISRCLFFVSDILRRILDQGGVTPPKRGEKAPFYLTPEQLLGFAFSDQPIPVSEITRRINALIDDNTMKTLRYSSITEYLMNCGFLYEVTLPNGNTTKQPTDSGIEIGLSVEERTSMYGNYLVTLYNSEAQHFIIDNFSAILEIANTPKQKPEKTSSQGRVWFADEDAKLTELFQQGVPVPEIARFFKRTESGIRARLVRLNLIEHRQNTP